MELRNIREQEAVDALIELLKNGNYRKAKVNLGQLKGNPKKFMDLFSYLTENTSLEGVEISIKEVKAKVKCHKCDWKGDPELKGPDVRCPRCFSDVDILRGNEFQVHV